jgi:hypothetical protein
MSDQKKRDSQRCSQHRRAPTSIGPQAPITIERVERGLALLAYLMSRDGPVLAPLFEKLERELDAMRTSEDTVGRAKRLLENLVSPMQRKLLDAPRIHSEQED